MPISRPSIPSARNLPSQLKLLPGKFCNASEDYIDQPIYTEDYATIMLHYENGVRGVLTVSQVSLGTQKPPIL